MNKNVTELSRRNRKAHLLPNPKEKPTLSVEEAGRVVGVGRVGAYEAARRGEIPSIRIGRYIRVPTAQLLTMLGIPVDSEGNAVLTQIPRRKGIKKLKAA